MKKIIICIFAVLVLLSSIVPAFAEEVVAVDLDEAIELAKENSIILKNFDDHILLAERELKSAIYQSEVVNVNSIISDYEYFENGMIKEFDPYEAQKYLDDFIDEKALEIRTIEIEVTSLYYSLYHEMLTIEAKKDSLSLLESEFLERKFEYDLGLVTEFDLYTFEKSLNQLKLSLSQSERSIEMLQMELAKELGLELDTKILLVNYPQIDNTFNFDLEQIVELSKTDSIEVLEAIEKLELKKLEEKVASKYTRYMSPDNIEDYDQSIVDLEKALEETIADVELKIRTDYNNIESAQYNLEISRILVEIAEMSLDEALVMNELGLNTSTDLLKSIAEVEASQLNMQKCVVELFKLVENFKVYTENLYVAN